MQRKRRKLAILLCGAMLLLAACGAPSAADEALIAREAMLQYEQISGNATLTADYGLRVYDFGVTFSYQKDGDITLTLTAPETVSGISATLEQGTSALHFDDMQIETGALTDSGLSPLGAIPRLFSEAKEGYISACAFETLGEQQVLRVDYRNADAQPGTGEEVSIWFDATSYLPLQAELLSDGYRVVAVQFETIETT